MGSNSIIIRAEDDSKQALKPMEDNATRREKKECRKSIDLHERVAIRPGHSVPIISPVLSIIRPIRRIPCLIVHRTIQPLGDAVFGKDIGIEEDLCAVRIGEPQKTYHTHACHVTSVRGSMLAIICRLHITRIGTCLRSITLALAKGKVLIAHVATRRRWGIDGTA